MSYFGLQTRHTGRRRGGRRRRGRKGEIKPRYGCMTLVWILVGNCMIFVDKLLGYG